MNNQDTNQYINPYIKVPKPIPPEYNFKNPLHNYLQDIHNPNNKNLCKINTFILGGAWKMDEHLRLLSVYPFVNDYKQLSKVVGTRDEIQVKTHLKSVKKILQETNFNLLKTSRG